MFVRCVIFLMLLAVLVIPCAAQTNGYAWLAGAEPQFTIASRIATPEGFRRINVPYGSFADWLRHLPLKKPGTAVLLHNGKLKPNQDAHFAVVDIDTGPRDLQQCADAIIRLRAEYLLSKGAHQDIQFRFTSGDRASWGRWESGYRPHIEGNKVTWAKSAREDSSYTGFRSYLDVVFTYAGTASLSRELTPRLNPFAIQIGDIFIRGGSPGHAVIVVDMAEHVRTGEKVFLLAQSYMPAQDMHVLKNPTDDDQSPWYRIPSGDVLETPEWRFDKTELKTFENHGRARQASPAEAAKRRR
ncbi:MAG: DUF4846 domain-containing protein [Desulfomonile tiedjei]|nr:DUF4846 domain-containing protein [Desulfomonile tiedjei]